jgi:hypothetical protein
MYCYKFPLENFHLQYPSNIIHYPHKSLLLLLLFKFVTIFTKTLINNIYNMLQDNTRDWNVEQDLRPNYYLTPYDYTVYTN